MKNVKEIVINIPSEQHLSKINSTSAIKRLFRNNLKVGENKIQVNYFNYSEILRMQCSLYSVNQQAQS